MTYQKKQQTIVGIDYSLNSPAICIAGDDFDFNKCSFHFLTSKKKHIGKFGKNIFGYEIKDYKTPIERFTNISTWVLDIIPKHNYRGIHLNYISHLNHTSFSYDEHSFLFDRAAY